MRTNTGKKVRDNSKTDRLPAGDTIFQKEKKNHYYRFAHSAEIVLLKVMLVLKYVTLISI